MVIDATRYKAFVENPELYRLKYIRNLVPATQAYGLARGTAFHTILELTHAGKSQAEIQATLAQLISDPKAIQVAWAMWAEWKRKYSQASYLTARIKKHVAELEFMHNITGSRHQIAGRIDEILEINGKLMVGEVKTANYRSDAAQIAHDWKYNAQADFEMLGARLSGWHVDGILVRVVRETTPISIWEIPVERTDQQLDVFLTNVDQVCNTIEMYRQYYGDDKPWPHDAGHYPCSMAGKCEYAGICGKPSDTVPQSALTGFMERQEHLTCLGGTKRAA